ncbi:MAG: 3-methyl-2-oxobutanoate dehydrogenase subunit beta, partial [Clostridia bacterium]
AFDKADKYRLPVMILGDGMLGQIMEAVELPPMKDPSTFPKKDWAADGTGIGEKRREINSLYIDPDTLEALNHRLFDTYAELERNETAYEEYMTSDAEVVLVAYGTVARIMKSAVQMLREKGVKVGLLRPITLFPFPTKPLVRLAEKDNVKSFLTVELSMGQMVEDVRLAVNGRKPVEFYGRTGGNVMVPEDVVKLVLEKEGK